MKDGKADGIYVGLLDGDNDGTIIVGGNVGKFVLGVSIRVGEVVGIRVGDFVGNKLGDFVGNLLGATLGSIVGSTVGVIDGLEVEG
eukprot:CAMPEP_0196764532 /NCGR_PEP_ID=MMETSP1095-20130614/6387_1 /TAXON_ID=96789 ORGANISM="Chromulina nebulosa, Strain UTEXLB2642" /NCGR_SAMPLE_ID=MMETSP1095 /ASSEMBLY_ACC=CAM_ASM_000446 /LENGTH=85 /DNA_ID=CAMNT_0042120427 /DNA_START=165 /DNA_END=422 /DNA_ORIENTATION=-